MTKKILISLFIVIILLNRLPLLLSAFPQTNIYLRVFRKGSDIFIKILTPLNMDELNGQIISKEGNIKSIINRNYFGIVNYHGKKLNEFIISNKENYFIESDKIEILSNGKTILAENIDSISYTIIEDNKDNKENEDKTIRIMTYNIHRGRDKAGNSNIEHIEQLIKSYNPDIVGLQEIDKNVSRTNFEDQLKKLADKLSMYYYFGSNKTFLKGEYGNGILSRYPILNVENILMPGKEPRGLLKAEILVNENSKINFLVTHLGLGIEERKNQFNTINHYIDMYEDDLILVGDFNTLDSDSNIINIQQKLNDAADKTIYSHLNTLNVFRNEYRVDYVFLNKRMKIKKYKVKKVEYSDHFPVFVDIEY